MSYSNIEIEVKDESGLFIATWRFWVDYPDVIFNAYTEWSRPTKRHKFVRGAHWNRIEKRTGSLQRPVVPESIKAEALASAAKNLVFKADKDHDSK